MPILNKIYDEYKEKYNFIAVTYESQKQVDKFLKKHLFKFLHIVDAGEFTDKLQLKSYPVNLFLDKNGIVIYSEYGIPYERDEKGKLKIGDGKGFIKKLEKLK